MLRRILAGLLNGTVLALVGLLVLALVIWLFGDEVHFGSHTPLESPTARLLLIALVVATWGAFRLWQWWKAHRENAALLNQVAKEEGPPADGTAADQDVAELRSRFEKALATLKTSTATSGAGVFGRLFRRRYVYQMPWYIFIGAPGSGKTTALVNSGLEFPLADHFGKAAVKGVGGTRNCDWWFTNQAVLIDTAGRYTTQESSQAHDKAEWDGFLKLLRRYRPQAPINGVILTVSVDDLLRNSDEHREAHAVAIRRRLAELYETLRVRFPVYLVVTKTDLLGGFNEYFERLTASERAQVWGFTFALQQDPAGSQGLVRRFRSEYALLQKRLEEALPDLLQAEPDVTRRALTYSFPQQFAGLREVLERFVTVLFAESKFAEPPLVRGIYFTSGTQEGTPFDRVLGAIQRRFGVDARVRAASAASGSGKSFFLRGLLQDLVFGEAHLVEHDPRRERQRRIVQGVAMASMAVVLVVACTLWVLSYANNARYLGEVGPKVQALDSDVDATPNRANDDIFALLPLLDEARDLPLSKRFDVAAPPLTYQAGLYTGDTVKTSSELVYGRLLEDMLLPRLAYRLHDLLARAPAEDMSTTYSRLEAYLMLYDTSHQRGATIIQTFARELAASGEIPAERIDALSGHLQNLFADRARYARSGRDDGLIEAARERLAGYGPADLAYDRLLASLPPGGRDWTLVSRVSPQAEQFFARRSGQSIRVGVPWAYTVEGYRNVLERLSKPDGTVPGDENWVLGRAAQTRSGKVTGRVTQQASVDLRERYLKTYRDKWEAFLGDVSLKPPRDIDDAIRIVSGLGGPDAKLATFVTAVAEQTTTLEKTAVDSSGLIAAGKKLLDQKLQRSSSTYSGVRSALQTADDRPGQLEQKLVDDNFRDWKQLADSGAQGRGRDIKDALQKASQALYEIKQANAQGGPPPSAQATAELRRLADTMPPPLKGMLQIIATSTSRQAAVAAKSVIARELETVIGDTCKRTIAGRYPFVRNAVNEVALRDFDAMFAPDGSLQRFFDANLASKVDRTGSAWSYRKDLDPAVAGDAATLAEFQNAARIRQAFYTAGSRGAQFRVVIRPVEVDTAITDLKLNVDGNTLQWNPKSPPLQPRPVLWPGPGGGGFVELETGPEKAVVRKDGPWALHRLYDAAHVSRGAAEGHYNVDLTVGGKRVKFDFDTGIPNPLQLTEMERFRCPVRL